uniref:Uncharacterized protein n=1 Tax=Caenorhabditis japonica TaxID=281687 RepID=A0A8R1DFK2_CAEJA
MEVNQPQKCVNIGDIVDNIQKNNFVARPVALFSIPNPIVQHQQKATEHASSIASDIESWKNASDDERKAMEHQIGVLRQRQQQIRQSSMEMSVLVDQIKQRLGNFERQKLGNGG